MTLGGIALAVGMLVDDATVEIENIHRNHALDKPLLVAILDGASQIATPTFVGTLSICIVFFPVVLLTGVARFLFTPLALAVVFAMLTSYLLSRTLVPSMARYLLPDDHEEHLGHGRWGRIVRAFDRSFERLKQRYRVALATFIGRRGLALTCVAISDPAFARPAADRRRRFLSGRRCGHDAAASCALPPAPVSSTPNTWSTKSTGPFARSFRPPELESISDNIGLPISYDLAFYQTDSIGPQDADVLIQLKPNHRPTAMYEQRIRDALATKYPDVTAYFQAADIVSQVLNFGLPARSTRRSTATASQSDYDIALRLKKRMAQIPGDRRHADRRAARLPQLKVDVDRTKALQFGITQQQVAGSVLSSLSGAQLLQPNFWLDPIIRG